MRFATSAAAAASGLLLLGLSFYGQPAVYLRLAAQQWDELMDRPPEDQAPQPIGDQAARDQPATANTASDADQSASANTHPPASPDDDAANQRAALLQQEVERLRQELAARQQAPVAPAQAPAPAAAPPNAVASASPGAADTPPPTVVVTPPPAPPPVSAPTTLATGAPAAPTSKSTAAPGAQPPAAPAQVANIPAPLPTPPLQVPEHREASLEAAPSRAERSSDQTRPDLARPEQTRLAPARSEAPKAEAPKVEPPHPAPPKPVAQKPIPAPPPLPQPAPPQQQGADDAQSVLARLRQIAPGAPPVQEADATPAPERPRPAASPSLPRLNAARNALASGQIDEARRLLQQAQLQLVFGPVDSPNDDSQSAGKGAADVAHALDALSANDVALSRRYVDVAMGHLSGAPVSPPVQETSRRASGYAPAYPPR